VPKFNDQAAIAAPYESVRGLGSGSRRALVMAAHGSPGVTLGYDAYLLKPDGITWNDPIRVHALTPDGVLSDAIDEASDEIVVAAGVDLDRLASVSEPGFASGENLLWMVTEDGLEEFVAFQNVSGTSMRTLSGLARGCLDTAPTALPAGTWVWFVSYGHEIVSVHDPEPPASTRENTIRYQAYNRNGSYDFDECEDAMVIATTPPRAERVYCPTDVRFNGESYPSSISGELTVSWSHRNRLGTWSYVDSGATASAEPGTEYDVLVYGELGTLVHTESGLTDTSWTYLAADEIAESGLGRLNNHLRVVVKTWGAAREHEAMREIEWEVDRV
jgi:hypothetical protein